MIYYTIYKITNIINEKIYIGVHKTDNLNDNYYGSGKILQQAIQKYGIENFKKEILYLCDSENDMYELEELIVDNDFLIQENVYNIKCGGMGGFPENASKNGNKKILWLRKNNEEWVKKWKLNLKENNSKYWKNKKFSENHKSNLSKARKDFLKNGGEVWNKNKKMSKEFSKNVSRALLKYYKIHESPNKNKTLSENHKKKIGEKSRDRIWIFKEDEEKRIKKEVDLLLFYLLNDWQIGRIERCWIYKENKSKRIKKKDKEKYLKNGWKEGRILLPKI